MSPFPVRFADRSSSMSQDEPHLTPRPTTIATKLARRERIRQIVVDLNSIYVDLPAKDIAPTERVDQALGLIEAALGEV